MARIEVLRWAEVEAVDFERYATSVDGLAWTGSAFRVNSEEPAVLRAAELLKAAITARTPCFGSCWGLQLVASRLGGKVEPAAQGPQVKIEKEISATANGRNHPLLSGKAERFQAVHIHDDEITELHAAAGVQPIDRGRGRDYPPRRVGVLGHAVSPEFSPANLAVQLIASMSSNRRWIARRPRSRARDRTSPAIFGRARGFPLQRG